MIKVAPKYLTLLIVAALMLCVASCEPTQTQKPYSIYWHDNNLCVTMPRPTNGIIELGKVDWNGIELNDVADAIYRECSTTKKSGNVDVWVRIENPQTDKYGNVTMAYDDHQIATIPLSEAHKYKSSKFLDAEYKLTAGIRKAAFGSTDNADDYDEWLKSQYNGATDTVRASHSSNTIELDYIAPNQYIAPTDTLDF